MLGPMVNPSFPKNQIVGVFSLELARMYGYLYQTTDKDFAIIHDLAGYDEISLTDRSKLITNREERIFSSADLGLETLKPEQIYGGASIKESAEVFLNVLKGKGSEAQSNVVCANAGMAIAVVENITHEEGFERAQKSLSTGRGFDSFKKLLELNN